MEGKHGLFIVVACDLESPATSCTHPSSLEEVGVGHVESNPSQEPTNRPFVNGKGAKVGEGGH